MGKPRAETVQETDGQILLCSGWDRGLVVCLRRFEKVQICRGFICKFKELRLLCDLFLATIRLNHGGATRNEKVRGEVLECDDFRMNHHRA